MSETTRHKEPDPAGKPDQSVADPAAGTDDFLTAGSPAPAPVSSHPKGAHRRTPREGLAAERPNLTAEQRLLILDSWQRSGLSGTDFSPLVGLSPKTLYSWRGRFVRLGPAGLSEKGPRKVGPSRLPEPTQRAILMLKQAHSDWGIDRIHDVLLRAEGHAASPGAILRVLTENGYVVEGDPIQARAQDAVRHFERARPNELWQSDLFTFVLKPSPQRVYLVIFMDDHSRFVVSYGLNASASGAMAREALSSGIANFGAPKEVLTDNGPQYASWRGKSAFTKLLEKRGVKHLLARPRRPQTLGKVERFWRSLWTECLESAVFRGLEDARTRVGHFMDYYNFQRPHQGLGDALVPADRFFSAAPEMRKTMAERVARNAAELARDGAPRKAFYLSGRVGDEGIALHGEGGRVILTHEGGGREEVDLEATGRRAHPGEPTELPPPAVPPAAVPPSQEVAVEPGEQGESHIDEGDES